MGYENLNRVYGMQKSKLGHMVWLPLNQTVMFLLAYVICSVYTHLILKFLSFLGLGVCVIAEFGRLLLYNILVDSSGEDENMDDSEDSDNGEAPNTEEFRGYKQMLLILRSKSVETGKSFLAELLLRMYHGKKRTLHSTLSFDSAKVLLGKGEPIVIDDWNNDEIGQLSDQI